MIGKVWRETVLQNKRRRKIMGRKTGWRVLAICLLFVFLVGSCGCARKAPPEKPPKAGAKVPQPETVERQESQGGTEGGGMP